jgi:Trp operon repressor
MRITGRRRDGAPLSAFLYTHIMPLPPKYYRELYELIASVKTAEEARLLLSDLLTPQEMDSMAERWQLVQLLAKDMPQRDISEKLGISISKITRGSRVMQHGTGGFAHFLKRLKRLS